LKKVEELFENVSQHDKEKILKDTINSRGLIEYNETLSTGRNGKKRISRRVLLRNNKSVLRDNDMNLVNLCLVIDIDTAYIITVYANRANDNHSSLHHERLTNKPLNFCHNRDEHFEKNNNWGEF